MRTETFEICTGVESGAMQIWYDVLKREFMRSGSTICYL